MPFLRSVIAHKSSKREKATALTDRVASKSACCMGCGASLLKACKTKNLHYPVTKLYRYIYILKYI
jgi:hypothetical protein